MPRVLSQTVLASARLDTIHALQVIRRGDSYDAARSYHVLIVNVTTGASDPLDTAIFHTLEHAMGRFLSECADRHVV